MSSYDTRYFASCTAKSCSVRSGPERPSSRHDIGRDFAPNQRGTRDRQYSVHGCRTHYGVPRSTLDIDIVIDPTRESLLRFVDSLDPQLYYFDRDAASDAFQRRSQFNLIDLTTMWKVDLIVRKARAFDIEEMSRRMRTTLFGVELYVMTVEDAIIAKLEWAKLGDSERQLRDVYGMIRLGIPIDRGYIERWVRDLELDELWQKVQS